MPFQPIESRRLYRQIADQLRQHIQRGEFPVGSKLPTERDLAQKLGVSRPSVREALIALEVEGLIEVRRSAGIFVMARESVRRVETSAHGPLETIRARQVLESELAASVPRCGSTRPCSTPLPPATPPPPAWRCRPTSAIRTTASPVPCTRRWTCAAIFQHRTCLFRTQFLIDQAQLTPIGEDIGLDEITCAGPLLGATVLPRALNVELVKPTTTGTA